MLLRITLAALVSAVSLLMAQAPDAATPEAERIRRLDRQLAQQKHLLADWGGLNHYGSDNTELPALAPGEQRVIFFGDQITEFWNRENESYFAGNKLFLNRGVAGQTTAQMLVRFRQDVISLHPKVVVILGGLNDVAGLRGIVSGELILDNLTSMTELAKANGIRVVLASMTPVCDCFTKGTRWRWQERITETNELIEKLSQQSGSIHLDYYSALTAPGDPKDESKDMKKEFTKDGVVPNEAGYALMASLANKAIAEALKR